MTWEQSDRRSELPADWDKIRARILRRDRGLCVAVLLSGRLCHKRATDVDHIKPGQDHSEDNLQSLCTWHHRKKTALEGNAARRRSSSQAPTEQHPGTRP